MWIFAQLTIGAIRQIGSAIVIAIFILLGTSLPEIFVKYFRLAEPWFLTPYPRYAIMAACALILILLSVWERLFASPLEKARLQLVREALDFLENHKDTKHLKWVKNNLAGGTPDDETGSLLNSIRLVGRDYSTGWSGIKSELQQHVASEIARRDRLIRKFYRWMVARTASDLNGQRVSDETDEFAETGRAINNDQWSSMLTVADKVRRACEGTALGIYAKNYRSGTRADELSLFAGKISEIIPSYGVLPPTLTSEQIKWKWPDEITFNVNGGQMDSRDNHGREGYRFIHVRTASVDQAVLDIVKESSIIPNFADRTPASVGNRPIAPIRKPAVSIASDKGRVVFDYASNDHIVTVGQNEATFKIRFSRAGASCIHVYGSPEKFARVKQPTEGDIIAFEAFNNHSSKGTLDIGDIFIMQNESGYYIQGKIIRIKAERHNADEDEVIFDYEINRDQSSEFRAL